MSSTSSTPGKPSLVHYELLADLFVYPHPRFADDVKRVHSFLAGAYPKAAEMLAEFYELLPADDLIAMQELYTRSFDVQSITTLDVGYVMFGDDYKRGELLSNMNREQREAGNDCGNELSDHLPNLLRLLPKLTDRAFIEELVQELVAPALKTMIGEFDPKRLAAKDKMFKKHHKTLIDSSARARTIYSATLEALIEVLDSDFDLIDNPIIKQTSSFLPMVKAEMELEPLK